MNDGKARCQHGIEVAEREALPPYGARGYRQRFADDCRVCRGAPAGVPFINVTRPAAARREPKSDDDQEGSSSGRAFLALAVLLARRTA